MFPERISNKVARAGEKALKSEYFSPERKKANKKIRNNSKALSSNSSSSSRISTSTSKKNGGEATGIVLVGDGNSVFQGDSSDNTIDADAAAGTTSTVLVVEGTAEVVASSGGGGIAGGGGAVGEGGSTRPAVTCERLSNVVFPYITGIAVRP